MRFTPENLDEETVVDRLRALSSSLLEKEFAIESNLGTLMVVPLSSGRFYVHMYDDVSGDATVLADESSKSDSSQEMVLDLNLDLDGRCKVSLEMASEAVRWFLRGRDIGSKLLWVSEDLSERGW